MELQDLTANVRAAHKAGAQSAFAHKGGDPATGLTIFSGTLMTPCYAYRVTATGHNVLLTIKTGTSEESITNRVLPPARFVATGSLTVFARVDDASEDALARVKVEYVQAGEAPNVAGFEDAAGGAVTLQPNTVGFRALTACQLTIRGIVVNLTAGQFLEFRGPASLDSGQGTPLYQP